MRYEIIMFIVMTICLLVFVATCLYIGFSIPKTSISNPIEYATTNLLTALVFYFISGISMFSLLLGCIFGTKNPIEYAHPLSLGGVFIFATSLLLLSSFFVYPSTPEESSVRFYDTHPIIFYTAIVLLTLGIVGAISNTIKMEERHHHHKQINGV